MSIGKTFDVAIVGGGPAGMAAALWCTELGLSACLLEKNGTLGGQLNWIHNPITNYPGADFRDGANALERFRASLSNRAFDLHLNAEVLSIDTPSRSVETSTGRFTAKAMIFATGVRRRSLGVPGEVEYKGKGILLSGARDRRDTQGSEVAVIGGGDAALENALILAEFASKVYLIHRGSKLSARREFVEAVSRNEKVELLLDTIVERFSGDDSLELVEVVNAGGVRCGVKISHAVIRIGVEPNSSPLVGLVHLDERSYVVVDALGRTSVEWVYAVGDLACPVSPTIATAVGSAATAIKSIARFERDLE